MSRTVYVNGRYAPYGEAQVHVEDRGFQFADAVYEVFEIWGGAIVDAPRHLDRLERSLRELEIRPPMSRPALGLVLREVIRRNRVRNGIVYLQVTRGAGRRDFPFPAQGTPATVVCLARAYDPRRIESLAETGIAVKTMPDIRWARRDIKTVMLLPACLAKEAARREGAREAWLLDSEGFITEGASSNAWIVDRERRVITRQADQGILAGVTRATLIDLLANEGLSLVLRPFHRDEALQAAEAFITAASNTVMPVTRIDGSPIGEGKPGHLTRSLREKFHGAASLSGVGGLFQF